MGCITCKNIQLASAEDIEAMRISELSRMVYVAPGSDNSRGQRSHLPFFMVPFAKDPNFVGRKAIFKTLAEILIPANAHKRAALVGLGGIG